MYFATSNLKCTEIHVPGIKNDKLGDDFTEKLNETSYLK
jgi:hypothetical protein